MTWDGAVWFDVEIDNADALKSWLAEEDMRWQTGRAFEAPKPRKKQVPKDTHVRFYVDVEHLSAAQAFIETLA